MICWTVPSAVNFNDHKIPETTSFCKYLGRRDSMPPPTRGAERRALVASTEGGRIEAPKPKAQGCPLSSRLKAKFRYANWFEADWKLVADQLRTT